MIMPPSWISEKNVNNSGLNKDICIKFYGKMHHGHAEKPRHQKWQPKVNSRDVIKWKKVWRISASISVTITDIWTKFGTEHRYHTIKTPVLPYSHKLKIQDGGGRHFEFRKNVNNSGLDTDICTKFYGKMHHGDAEMTHGQKSKPEVNSCDVIK